jgi:LPS-assembly protein
MSSGLYFDRNLNLFGKGFIQTLEPQAYYTYIPFRNQNELPLFDTTLNQPSYDQLFMYNRFSGIDRIGDANQVALGLITRFIDQNSGNEKIRAGLGQVLYFENRRVTLCTTPNCSDIVDPMNKRNRSPIAGLIKYSMNPLWSAEANTIWDPLERHQRLINQTFALHYSSDPRHLMNIGYTFAKNGDRRYLDTIDKSSNNLSQTDFSAAWPLTRDWSGVTRWTQNLNRHGFQNLLFGVQYDACCWAVRLVAGREFVQVNPDNNHLQYNTLFFIQFALKGLGNFGTDDPTQLLASSVSGYQTQFGQDY